MAYNKSPFKMAGKSPLMKQLLGNQGNLPMHLKEAIKASPAKQMGVDAGDTAAFEKSKEIESKFEKKIEKAGGFGVPNEDGSSKNKRVNRLTKRANKRQERKVPRARKKADEKGYDMNNMDGTTTTLKGKNQKASPAKKYGKSPAKKHGMSPLKQVNREDGVQVNEVPAVVGEEVKKAGKFVKKKGKRIGKFFKKLVKKAGDITLTKTKKQKIEKQEKKLKDLKDKK